MIEIANFVGYVAIAATIVVFAASMLHIRNKSKPQEAK